MQLDHNLFYHIIKCGTKCFTGLAGCPSLAIQLAIHYQWKRETTFFCISRKLLSCNCRGSRFRFKNLNNSEKLKAAEKIYVLQVCQRVTRNKKVLTLKIGVSQDTRNIVTNYVIIFYSITFFAPIFLLIVVVRMHALEVS